jgi:hypothetical protein
MYKRHPEKKRSEIKKFTADSDRKSVVDSIELTIPEMKSDIEHCLFKLYYGNKYIISKAKNLAGTLFLFQKGYAYFFGYDHKAADNREHHYFKIYNYIRNHPGEKFRVEVIVSNNDCFELLKAEYLELRKVLRDKKCFNRNVSAYIPKFVEKTGMYNWIPATAVDQFNQWVEAAAFLDNK